MLQKQLEQSGIEIPLNNQLVNPAVNITITLNEPISEDVDGAVTVTTLGKVLIDNQLPTDYTYPIPFGGNTRQLAASRYLKEEFDAMDDMRGLMLALRIIACDCRGSSVHVKLVQPNVLEISFALTKQFVRQEKQNLFIEMIIAKAKSQIKGTISIER